MGTSNRRVARTARATNSNRQNRKTSSVTSLENGISILRYAIKKKVSLSAASKAGERGKNYISDIKSRLEENYKSKNISKELYSSFKSLNKQYEKVVK